MTAQVLGRLRRHPEICAVGFAGGGSAICVAAAGVTVEHHHVSIGPDGWPLRSAVESAWRAVVAGELSREDVHAWSVRWVERGDLDPPTDPVVESGLQDLHGLDMTSVPGRPGFVDHGGPGPYRLSEDEVAEKLTRWLAYCREFDEDPEGPRRRNRDRARALAALAAERQRDADRKP